MMLTCTPRRLTLGIHLPEVDSKSLVDHVLVVDLLKSLDGPVSGSDELFVLCRSSYEPSEFTQ